jgi:putative membrane protein
MTGAARDARLPWALFAVVAVVLVVSGIRPYDRGTWWAEVAPVLIAAPILVATSRRFPLTTLLYVLIAIHAVILIVGGAYTYARVPFGFWLQDLFGFERNPYDRLGHFVQGFVPVLIAREVLLRNRVLRPGRMAAFLCVCVALAVSAAYELVEWAAAVVAGDGSVEFLGTQGDPWDAQADMLMALIGAVVALAALAGVQDRQIARLEGGPPAPAP